MAGKRRRGRSASTSGLGSASMAGERKSTAASLPAALPRRLCSTTALHSQMQHGCLTLHCWELNVEECHSINAIQIAAHYQQDTPSRLQHIDAQVAAAWPVTRQLQVKPW